MNICWKVMLIDKSSSSFCCGLVLQLIDQGYKACSLHHNVKFSQLGSTGRGGHFDQNGKKMHKCCKIIIFGAKYGGYWRGGKATFLNTLGIPLIHSQPSSLQETLNWGQLELQGNIVLYFAEIVFAQETLRAS